MDRLKINSQSQMPPVAVITGITGQDGTYLAEFLLKKGYEVHGVLRPGSTVDLCKISQTLSAVHLTHIDLTDERSIADYLKSVGPTEVYNLAAQSFVPASWKEPVYTADITGLIPMRIMTAIQTVNPQIRFYQAGSSEMYGRSESAPQNERTPMRPCNPYAMAKTFAFHAVQNYRETNGLFACTGILFNHESPRRPAQFVTRKITTAAARISLGLQDELFLGNLEARRDWGFAGDYVESMYLMLQQDTPKDYVIGSGKATKVQEFVDYAFEYVGLQSSKHVKIDPQFFRPTDPNLTLADYSLAQAELGWRPKTTVQELVAMMVDHDLELAKRGINEPHIARFAEGAA